MPLWMTALAFGLLGGAALVIGCAVAWKWTLPAKAVSTIMAFGAGVLISALAFELVDEAVTTGGIGATITGFLVGASLFVAANVLLARKGAQHRKRSGDQQPAEGENPGSGTAIAVGALLDGIPESLVLGLGLVAGGSISPAMLGAVFISNIPEGLSSTAGMKKAGRSARYVFGVWSGIAVLSGISALVGYVALQDARAETVAFINALAAGAILAMIVDTMIPEAFEEHHLLTGFTAALGFVTALGLDAL
ncbi:ZIP family metal transporter [Arthrobacter sulfonylureivorans]|uniref:ZIP family zinc transporter n=1 Tax=Arthrobacter sulfonylureivorans TaxID=2486855 RepID=A0ABY3WA12_9MICC|nr:ZIP family zinc transporter [Arthrobacter sulfonylureivorans]UNK46316.1 ZIP family zinc transporter [Arthrobacter sulfonylureivorans]